MSTVAIVATYVPSEHFGGPARIHHMGAVLRAAGHRVSYVVIAANHPSERLGQLDMLRVVERPFRAKLDHIYSDVDLAHRAAADRSHVRAITEHLRSLETTAIILEHPFLIDTVAAVAANLAVPLVYSCANIEHRLMHDLERFMFDWKRRTDRFEEVRALEQRSIDAATSVTAICRTDQTMLRAEFGAESVLVPNGSSLADYPLPRPDHPSRRADSPVDFAIAGSAYWPNTEGLAMIAWPSLAFLPPIMRIHVAGSMSREILKLRSVERRHSANASRMTLRGFLEADELVATFHAARAILVPIFTGEGSNLKTADALASGRPVIATERAMRGYEDVLAADASGVVVVSDVDQFRAAMAEVARSPRPSLAVGAARHAMLGWNERLQPLVGLIGELTGARA
jgi:glycosyltransferase involved in cell wall biosynthesis